MKGTLLFVSADIFAAHYIDGYKSLSSALRKCRHCLATNDDMASKVLHGYAIADRHKGLVKYCALVYS